MLPAHVRGAGGMRPTSGRDRRFRPLERPDAATQVNFSAIKLIAEECLLEASDVTLQVFGGLGLLRSTGIELIFRVARNLRIPGGTTEMQNRTIARSLGLLAMGEETEEPLA